MQEEAPTSLSNVSLVQWLDALEEIARAAGVSTEPVAHIRQTLQQGEEQFRLLFDAQITRDITERKRAEDELAQANANIDTILESIADWVLVIDHDWRCIYSNRKSQHDIPQCASSREILGRCIWDVFPELAGSDTYHKAQQAMTQNVAAHTEFLLHGSGRWIESYIYPTQGGILLYGRDITEQRLVDEQRRHHEEALKQAKEAAEAANCAKDHFLAMLSHELRTPLTPVLATIAMMEHHADLPAELREEIRVIQRNVELEARLIDDLLDLTRITRGKVELHREAVDIHAILRQTLEICHSELHDKRLEVSLGLWAHRHMVWADPGRIQQVFWNIVKNAVKFTPQNGRIALRTTDVDHKDIRIEISDNGIGIDKDVLSHLFTAFEQGGKGITRQFGGLGLGLAISKSIVDLHGGKIRAASEGKGTGATFIVELGAAAEGASAHTVPITPSEPRKTLKQATILFVEDNEDTRKIMVRLLRYAGYEVLSAGTVREAMDVLGRQHVDLLLSDLGLPDGSGYDIMRQLKGRKNIKGIALSGYGMEEDIARSMESGFSRHLVKPVKPTELNAAISELAATS